MQEVLVYGINGQILMQGPANASRETLTIEALPEGIYFIRIVTARSTFTEKLIIRR